jgi:hypothetical protein
VEPISWAHSKELAPLSHYHSRSNKTTTLSSVDHFYVGTIQRIFLFSDDFYSDTTLILTTSIKQCMCLGARPRVCGVFLPILMFVLTLTDGLCCEMLLSN